MAGCLSPAQVEAIVRWYLLDGGSASGFSVPSWSRGGSALSTQPGHYRVTVGLILGRLPEAACWGGRPLVVVAVAAELEAERADREGLRMLANEAAGVSVVGGLRRAHVQLERALERSRRAREADGWDCCVRRLGEAFAAASLADPCFLPVVLAE